MKLRGLYAITDSQLLAGKFLSYVEAALEGGVTLLQYRDKSSDEARRLREAEALRDLCEGESSGQDGPRAGAATRLRPHPK